MSNIQNGQKFDTAKIVLSWRCNMDCSYCCNKQKELQDTFISIRKNELKDLPHKDFELTGGEPLETTNFSQLLQILDWNLPKKRNYYLYTNGVLLKETQAKILKHRNITGINIGYHPNQTIIIHTDKKATLRKLDWNEICKVHQIIPMRLWVQDIDYKDELTQLGFPIKIWKLGDCDEITTDRYIISD